MGNLVNEFIEYIGGVRRFSARTQQGYRDVLEDFSEFLQRELDRLDGNTDEGRLAGPGENPVEGKLAGLGGNTGDGRLAGPGENSEDGRQARLGANSEDGRQAELGVDSLEVTAEDRMVLRGMTSQVLRGYEVYLLKERGLSARSVGLYLSVLSSFAKFLMKKDLLTSNPVRMVSRPKVPKRLPEFYRKDSIDSYFEQTRPYGTDTILDLLGQSAVRQAESEPVKEYRQMKAAKSDAGQTDSEPVRTVRGMEKETEKDRERENERKNEKENERERGVEMELYGKCLRRLIISILYNTGIRRSELIGLERSQFDPARGVLHVRGKGDKMREIPLTSSLCEEILLYLEVLCRCGFDIDRKDSPLLLTPTGRRLYPQFVDKAVKMELGTVPGISGRKSPHVLRHTIATELLDEGTDINSIKELLGHSSLAATQVYTHNSIEKLKKVYNQAHPRQQALKK